MKDELNYEALAKEVEATDKQLAEFFRMMATQDGAADTPMPDPTALQWPRQRAALCLQLYTARQQQKLTQTELAARIGMPQSSLARIEAGHSNPNLKTLFKIAAALHMQIVLHPKEQSVRIKET